MTPWSSQGIEYHLGETSHLLASIIFRRERQLFIITKTVLLAISPKVPRRRVARRGQSWFELVALVLMWL